MSGIAETVEGAEISAEEAGFVLDSLSHEDTASLARTMTDAASEPASAEPEPASEPEPAPAARAPKAEAAKPATDAPAPNKRLDAIQARIAAATRERHQVLGELEARRAELEELDRQIAARKAPQDAPAATAAKTEAPAAKADAPADDPRPRWSGANGYEAQDKTYEQYESDLEAWEGRALERRIAAVQADIDKRTADAQAQASESQRDRELDQRHRSRVEALRADPEVAAAMADPEFTSMPLTPFMSTAIRLHDKGDTIMRHLALHPADGYALANLTVTDAIRQAVRDSEEPVALLSALANNPEEAERISHLSGTRALRALFALETSQSGAKSGTPAAVPRQPVATPLPARVQASRSVATPRPKSELSTDDFDEFAARDLAGEDD